MATFPSPPILIWQPDGGTPSGELPSPIIPPTPESDLHIGSTQLVSGQSYIDVVFSTPQATVDWTLIECAVFNIIDVTPLNIWPGIITAKTTTGFRLQLNGMPDSSNYYLSWTISGESLPPVLATTYFLTGPATGTVGAPQTFTVALPVGTTVAASVTVTPIDGGGGGSFAPTSVMLTDAAPSATFDYTPASAGTKTISVTNDGALTNPANLSFVASAFASAYSLSGPSSGAISTASTNFTVTLVGGGVAAPVTVTPSAGGGGGTFAPASVILTTGAPSATFTYTPASYGAKTISVTNDGGLTDPGSLTYTSTAGYSTTYTLTGPSSGAVSAASTNFTAALPGGGSLASPVTVTPSDGGGGGTFTPTTVSLSTGTPSATFTYTPASTGTKTISATNSGGLTNPGNLSYIATGPPFDPTTIAGLKLWLKADALALSDGAAVATWNDSSVNGNNATAPGGRQPTFKTNIVNGLPVARTASGNYMDLTTAISGAAPWTAFAVMKAAASVDLYSVLSLSAVLIGPTQTASGLLKVRDRNNDSSVVNSWTGGFHVFTGKSVSTVAAPAIWVDGVSQTVSTSAVAGIDDFTNVCAGTGDIAEILLYNVAISTTDRQNVEGYLKIKYATP